MNKYILKFGLTALLFAILTGIVSAETVYNESFENGKSNWSSLSKGKLVLGKFPATNTTALRITGKDIVKSPYLKLQPAKRYMLKFNTWSEKRGQFQIRIQEFDKKKKLLSVANMYRLVEQLWRAKSPRRRLLAMEIPFDTAPDGGRVRIIIKKHGNNTCWFDDIAILERPEQKFLPVTNTPLAKDGTYTRKSLMLPGPDGVLYPNFTNAGVQEWKSVNKYFKIENFGGIANDGKDDSTAFIKACAAAESAGGGIVLLKTGVYRLTSKLLITKDKIIIRGAGQKKTKIIFNMPDSKIFISTYTVGAKIIPRIPVTIFFAAEGAKEISLSIDGKNIKKWNNPKQFKTVSADKNFRTVSVSGKKIMTIAGTGLKKLKVEVIYSNGTKRTIKQKFLLENSWYASWDTNSLISFNGMRNRNKALRIPLEKDLLRGARKVVLKDASQFHPGGYITITAPETKRWNKLSLNTCKWGNFRKIVLKIEKNEGNIVFLNQAIKINFPLIDKAYAETFQPIQFCGIENLTIEQEGKIQKALKIGTVLFRNAANCRAKNITVIKSGFRPLYGRFVKNCQISDCTLKGAWDTQKTLAYAGFDYGWDCMIERMETFSMRHGPTLNWVCSGNVIRDSVFHDSDAQWHSGWCSDNLFEQCRVESISYKHRGYGYAFYSSPYNDSGHGPNGPRNVVYNCDSISIKSAVFMGGGGNNNWLLMYNRFKANSGPGIIQRLGCKNTRIQGNVFMLKDPKSPLLYYEFMDNTGDIVKNNTVYGGNGRLFQGAGKPREAKGNRFLPFKQNAPKPTPPTPSIYKWQLKNYPVIKTTGAK